MRQADAEGTLTQDYAASGFNSAVNDGVQDRIAALRANLSKNTADQTLLALMNIADDMVSAGNYMQIARDSVDSETGYGSAPAPTTKVVAIAETLSRAGDVNLALFDSTEIAPAAQQLGIPSDAVKNRLMGKDDDHRFAIWSEQGERELDQQMKSG